MINNYNSHIKVKLITEDISEYGVQETPNNSFTVMNYEYKLARSRTETGKPHGPTLSVRMQCSVRMLTNESSKVFYDRLRSSESQPFSFLFGDELGLVFNGYITEVDEQFCTSDGNVASDKQLTLTFGVLMREIKYIGQMSNRILDLFT